MELFIGFVLGFLTAGVIGRVKFLKVQNALRERNFALLTERNLFAGLQQEFDALVAKTRLRKL